MKFHYLTITKFFLLGLIILSCKKEDDSPKPPIDPLADYFYVGEESLQNGQSVKLYFEESPFAGYNSVVIKLSGDNNENTEVSFNPIMDMGTMVHSTPHENPEYSNDLKAFTGSVTFIMPATDPDKWNFNVIVQNNGSQADTVLFQLEVAQKAPPMIYSFGSTHNSVNYFVALREPANPEVGLNDFELMVYYRQDLMNFPPAEDLVIITEPFMPSMGHGSPNNENPIHIDNGLYRGKVNFTMTGDWEVYIDVQDSLGNVHDDAGYFPFTVK